jgi:hypothetical protein
VRRQRRPTPLASPRESALALLACGLVALVLIGCSTAPSNGPSSAPSPSAAASPTDVPGSAGLSPSPGEVSQTDTDWGRIWDAVPPTFPRPPGSSGAQPIGREPTSADLELEGDAAGVIEFYQTMLKPPNFETDKQGPLEDGSWVLNGFIPSSECQWQVTATPLGGLSHVSILYGAGCPLG